MAGYSKEFLIDAFVSRYTDLGIDVCLGMVEMCSKYYDEVGKDTFRIYASLDADAIKKFKLESSS